MWLLQGHRKQTAKRQGGTHSNSWANLAGSDLNHCSVTEMPPSPCQPLGSYDQLALWAGHCVLDSSVCFPGSASAYVHTRGFNPFWVPSGRENQRPVVHDLILALVCICQRSSEKIMFSLAGVWLLCF